jgi:hypothetical protein
VAKRDEGRNKLQTWVRQVWLEQTLWSRLQDTQLAVVRDHSSICGNRPVWIWIYKGFEKKRIWRVWLPYKTLFASHYHSIFGGDLRGLRFGRSVTVFKTKSNVCCVGKKSGLGGPLVC